ncbi:MULTISPECIES: rod shape-determining protein MreD [Aerococcus]|uniref:Rod shape-determining protein MreD n=2 Tax=Aerococcus TaxID=1375 RepID=A0A178HD50_9LACT|nr:MULTISPECIES: rod shape-determining protein MreD [Aerococcus]KAA9219072.1 rod shape-determining protein MreD [Aerococcus loyolae]KAA9265107.1 rod shape-determining protein MreD [Aerococcus loyolae]MCY3026124.1 rod shape-determining protein MreD [Aerococcus loyolae]MCY3027596.1 rod shape-determining protein MreD [Aerococcus loyolae]MCY3029467.1 rod shape-determining protein MreD [Aerococcus loyolae]
MFDYIRYHLTLPIFLIFVFLLDGALVNVLLASVDTYAYQIIPSLLLISLTLIPLYYNQPRTIYLMAFIIGFLYDSYYNGILGINLFLFPAVVYLSYQVKNRFPLNFYSIWVWAVIMYLLYHNVIYWLYRILRIHGDTYLKFLASFLGPSLLFNSLVIFLLNLIIFRLVNWVKG